MFLFFFVCILANSQKKNHQKMWYTKKPLPQMPWKPPTPTPSPPTIECTIQEYDTMELKKSVHRVMISLCMVCILYWYTGWVAPLFFQIFMSPIPFVKSPLFLLHVLQIRRINRPFDRPMASPTVPKGKSAIREVIETDAGPILKEIDEKD